jgi:hypothetical protein
MKGMKPTGRDFRDDGPMDPLPEIGERHPGEEVKM